MPARRRRQVLQALQIAALLVVLPSRCLHAGESWEGKPYTDWTASEAQNVLTDSPWSKTAFVQVLGGSATAPTPSAISGHTPPGERCANCGPQGNVDAAANSAGLGTTSGWGSSPAGPVVYFRVLFFSSIHIRQALVRLARLQGNTVHPQIIDHLQRPLEDYVIALAGPFVRAFQDASLESLKPSTYLRSRKKGGSKLDLKLFLSPKERADGMALFFFPRGTDGSHPFDTSDKQIEFATAQGNLKIRVSFSIGKMAADGILDF